MDPQTDPLVEEGTLSVPAAVEFSDLSRSELYSLMARGELAYVQHGRRRLIPKVALKRLLASGLHGAGDSRPAA